MKIKMLMTVRPSFPALSKPGTVLRVGMEYEATANDHGAISGICENGTILGVKPGEFTFTSVTPVVAKKWGWFPSALHGARIEEEQDDP